MFRSVKPERDPVRYQTGVADQSRRRAALQRVPRDQPDGAGPRVAHRRNYINRIVEYHDVPGRDETATAVTAARPH